MENKTQKQEFILDRIGISFHRKLSFKLFTIGILVLLLLIPKVMILSLINERSANAQEAIREVTSKWSNQQIIRGPILNIPYKKQFYNDEKEKYIEVTETATFLPKQLSINGQINPEKLYRSIYDVVVYQSEINMSGAFDSLNLQALNIKPETVMWDKATLLLFIKDLRGINKEVRLNWLGNEHVFTPGPSSSQDKESAISVALPHFTQEQNKEFKLTLDLKGSKSLLFTPVGEKTEVELSSGWNDPGFIGNFLPADRTINEDGFKANWNVLHFNRNFPQQWINKGGREGIPSQVLHKSDFGVELVSIANHYQKNTRSAKYSILIIVITFVVFFLYEVFSRQRIHAFQYIMVGSAITLFYLLLLSITEHLGFNMAYLIATSAILVLVILYSGTFMPKLKDTMGVGAALAGCFGFVFILLQLESFALLTGSIGMFILLSVLMYTTRKVNWYKE